MKKVFAAYSREKVGLVRVWMESWERRGWRPQLLSVKEIQGAGSVRKAAEDRGGGVLADLLIINFGFWSRDRAPLRSTRINRAGWESAALVRFSPGASETEIRECGRCL
jgi:hypothetical protein